jgi:catechol 2,3-dioxygenase-like lactoylglutathione lyase family enzyme
MDKPIKVVELDHVVFRCRDIERALAFYVGVLGLAEERRIERIGLIQLRAGSGMIDLVPATERSEEGRNVDHVCLGIEAGNMGELADFLRRKGVEVMGEAAVRYGSRGMGVSIYVRDPEGNVLELKQIPPRE